MEDQVQKIYPEGISNLPKKPRVLMYLLVHKLF